MTTNMEKLLITRTIKITEVLSFDDWKKYSNADANTFSTEEDYLAALKREWEFVLEETGNGIVNEGDEYGMSETLIADLLENYVDYSNFDEGDCEGCKKRFAKDDLLVHSFGCVELCEKCAYNNGDPQCPNPKTNHEDSDCEMCSKWWEEIEYNRGDARVCECA